MENKIKPMNDKTADFSKCHIKNGCVYCKEHGAMICVKSDENEGVYRCPQARSLITGKEGAPCFAGCVSYFDEDETDSDYLRGFSDGIKDRTNQVAEAKRLQLDRIKDKISELDTYNAIEEDDCILLKELNDALKNK